MAEPPYERIFPSVELGIDMGSSGAVAFIIENPLKTLLKKNF